MSLRAIIVALAGHVWIACTAQPLKVLTWNVRYDNPADSLDRWDLRKDALAGFAAAERPAIIGLQECLVHQLTYLDAKWPGYARYGVGREDGIAQGEFCPVYYDTARFTLVEGRTIWLAPRSDIPGKGWDAACERIATLVRLRDRSRGDTIAVMNTHWDHMGAMARMNSAALIRQVLNSIMLKGTAAILMGDLNATPGTTEIGLLQSWLTDACPVDRTMEPTFNGFRIDVDPERRIDHVWYSPADWKTRSFDIPRPMVNGRHISDHFPVLVELERVDGR